MCCWNSVVVVPAVPTWEREEEYARLKAARLSEGKRLARSARAWEVASVQLLGVDLVSVSGRSSATNRACAMVLYAMEGNPALLNRHKGLARSRIASKTTEIAEQERNKET
jgi:hypothetical protein